MDVYKHIIYVLCMGPSWRLNQIIQRMNLLTNFPIFKEFVWQLLIICQIKILHKCEIKKYQFFYMIKTDEQKLHMIIKPQYKNIFLFRLKLSLN